MHPTIVCVAGACQHNSQILLQFNVSQGFQAFLSQCRSMGRGPRGPAPPPPHPNNFGKARLIWSAPTLFTLLFCSKFSFPFGSALVIAPPLPPNCWFSHDVTKTQTKKLSIRPRFYFHDALELLKTNFHTNFCFKRILGFVIEYA